MSVMHNLRRRVFAAGFNLPKSNDERRELLERLARYAIMLASPDDATLRTWRDFAAYLTDNLGAADAEGRDRDWAQLIESTGIELDALLGVAVVAPEPEKPLHHLDVLEATAISLDAVDHVAVAIVAAVFGQWGGIDTSKGYVPMHPPVTSVNELAGVLEVPRERIGRYLREAGLPAPGDWIALCRLLHAHRELQRGVTVQVAAEAAGFPDASALSTAMLRHIGIRPSAAREVSFEDFVCWWWKRAAPVQMCAGAQPAAECAHICKQCSHLYSHNPPCEPDTPWAGLCGTCERGGLPADHRMQRINGTAFVERRRRAQAEHPELRDPDPGGAA